MATDPKTDAEDGDHRLTPRPEDGAPLIMSCDPESECPECGAGGFRKGVDVTYGEQPDGGDQKVSKGAVLIAAVECPGCGIYDETIVGR